jgi:hypothetical protein
MKLEAGKSYRMRNGEVVKITRFFSEVWWASQIVSEGYEGMWYDDGRADFFGPKLSSARFDIVEEVK